MTGRTFAQILILATIVVWVGVDVYLYATYGNPSTISATIWRWSWHIPGVPFAAGVLCGHLFFQITENVSFNAPPGTEDK